MQKVATDLKRKRKSSDENDDDCDDLEVDDEGI